VRFEGHTTAGAQLLLEPGVRTRARGEARMPDRFHVVLTIPGDEEEVEVLGVGTRRWARSRVFEGEQVEGKWHDVFPPEETPGGRVGPPEGFGGDDFGGPGDGQGIEALLTHPVFVAPTGLPAVLAAAHDPVVRSRGTEGKAIELRADVDGAQLFGAGVPPLDRARLDLEVDEDGRIAEAAFFVSIREIGLQASVRFTLSGWDDGAVEIAAPPDDQIARDDVIDKKAVAAFTDVPLLGPRAVPQGWVLHRARVLEPQETVEGCHQLELHYDDPFDGAEGYLTIYEFPITCTEGPTEEQVAVFRAGAHVGFVEESGSGSRFGELYVGRTVVQFATDLSTADLAVVLGDLVPLDLDRAPGSLPGLGGPTERF
jgi:hypothetical protein